MVFNFLLVFKPDIVAITPDINAYLDFLLVIFLAFGISFELPVALVILVLLGWVTPAQLKEWRGYAIVGIFIVAAVITLPDVVSQLLLAIPIDRKSTRRTPVTNAHLVCRLLLEKKKTKNKKIY